MTMMMPKKKYDSYDDNEEDNDADHDHDDTVAATPHLRYAHHSVQVQPNSPTTKSQSIAGRWKKFQQHRFP